jgi:ABC-2 type transport system permease protein
MDWKFMIYKWITLWSKELRFSLYALPGTLFIVLFLTVSGCLLWLIPGEYNIPEAGYSSLASFFLRTPFLFLFLIPALSMRTFSEEKRQHTLLLLKSRPVRLNTILSAKITALIFVVLIAIIPTFIYVLCLYFYSNPVGNTDLGAIAASYVGLLFLASAFISIAVFASGITSNQVVALILGLAFSAFFYFGFDLAASLFSSVKTQMFLRDLGFLSHYRSVQRGLIETRDLAYFLAIGSLFYLLTLKLLGESFRSKTMKTGGALFLLFLLFSFGFNFRFDWTKDKRYTLSPVIPSLLKNIDNQVNIEIYLAGSLNSGFKHLQQSLDNLLNDIHSLSGGKIRYQTVNPYQKGSDFIRGLEEKGMKGIAINERFPDGKMSRHILFPYLLVQYGEKEIPVSLLVNQPRKSGVENLNTSIENLEYSLAYAFQELFRTESRKLLFLEGHGELTEDYLHDILDYLSSGYTIDRGIISGNPSELDVYDAVIVAGPRFPFPETDKFVLDQYLMQGGRLLWFVNGVEVYSYDELAIKGETISRANNLNLDDLFFTYGLRINPVLLQDTQSLNIPVAVKDSIGNTDFVEKPWYYSVLLSPNNQSAITKGLPWVKIEFASTISLIEANIRLNRKEILLTSSSQARSVAVPVRISLNETDRRMDKDYFNESQLPVAVMISGTFQSVFRNRTLSFSKNHTFRKESQPARMIVVASEELISNELIRTDKGIEPLPLGYDRYSQTQFGNKELILNMVNFLTDNEGLSVLRNKSLQLRLLDRQRLQQNRTGLIFWNVVLPPALLLTFFGIISIIRIKKYKLNLYSSGHTKKK